MGNKVAIAVFVLVLLAGGILVATKQGNKINQNQQTQQGSTVEQQPSQAQKSVGAPQQMVEVTNAGFSPVTVTVKVGTEVLWFNKTGAVANVSSAVHPTHLAYPPLNLGDFTDGTMASHIFTKAGTYRYHDHLSPTRIGTVVVE